MLQIHMVMQCSVQLSSTGPVFRKGIKQMEMPMFCIGDSNQRQSIVLGFMGIIYLGEKESINYCGSLIIRKVVLASMVPPQT